MRTGASGLQTGSLASARGGAGPHSGECGAGDEARGEEAANGGRVGSRTSGSGESEPAWEVTDDLLSP